MTSVGYIVSDYERGHKEILNYKEFKEMNEQKEFIKMRIEMRSHWFEGGSSSLLERDHVEVLETVGFELVHAFHLSISWSYKRSSWKE